MQRDPVTARGERVLLILKAAHAGCDLLELREERLDLWPRNWAGERKWTRDRRDALAGRVYSARDDVAARRERVAEALERLGRAPVRVIAAAVGASAGIVRADLSVLGAARCGRSWMSKW